MTANKANALGQSKASLRSVLPASDLQRYVQLRHMLLQVKWLVRQGSWRECLRNMAYVAYAVSGNKR